MEDLLELVLMVLPSQGRQRVVLNGLLNVESLVTFGALVFINRHCNSLLPSSRLFRCVLDDQWEAHRRLSGLGLLPYVNY